MSEMAHLHGAETSDVPWVETREGGLFFINAVLVAPLFMVLLPLGLRGLFRSLGALNRPSPVLDPIPAVAAHMLPVLGIALVIPLILTLKNLRIARRPAVKTALWIFLASHVGFLTYTVLSWFGAV